MLLYPITVQAPIGRKPAFRNGGVTDLPKPKPLSWENLVGFIGPGIVMCGIQTAGGEWLLGA